MNKKFKADFYRMTGKRWNIIIGIKNIISNPILRFEFYSRKSKNSIIYKILRKRIKNKYGLEFNMDNIGAGFYIGHPYNITINPKAIIGNCCNIHKGVTIGQENRGSRKGTPKIGDRVWIGINSTIVGKIEIGNDVLIAPNSYINCDVPSNSIVIGNPCKIIFKQDATKDYINNYDI